MSARTIGLSDAVYDYMLAVSLREPAVLKELREETIKLATGRMMISPEQGQLMRLLIEILDARKTLEIGVYTGYSSLAVALALPADGHIIACDINEEWTRIAQKYWQKAEVAAKIQLQLAPALQTLDQLIAADEKESFDFVFIDADKKNYLAYYEKSLLLLRRGGLILIDNTLWSGAVADSSVQDNTTVALRKFNEKLHDDQRVSLSLLPIGDGLTVARKR